MTITTLPNELTLQVLGHLEKHELKTARLVCKVWALCARKYLFDKLYISPREEDIRVFKLVTQHAQLRRCVKELEYDATRFPTKTSKYLYFLNLSDEIRMWERKYRGVYDVHRIKLRDPQIDDFVKRLEDVAIWEGANIEFAYQECKDYGFLVEGHRRWQECATYHEDCIRSGEFVQILISGFRNLERLESLHVCNGWAYELPQDLHSHQAHYYNSPFGRTWGIFRPKPDTSAYHHDRLTAFGETGCSNGYDDFWTITTALDLAQKRIRRLGSRELSPIVFEQQKQCMGDRIKSVSKVYSRLEKLNLHFLYHSEEAEPRSGSDTFSGFRSLLESTTCLQDLDLSFSKAWETQCETLALAKIIPREGKWMLLTSLDLASLRSSANDLIQLLTVRTSALRHLTLFDIELSEGRWEGVVETMRRSMHLSGLVLSHCYPLSHLNGQEFASDIHSICSLREYIINGGRHPSLLPDEPDSAAEKFLSEPYLP